MIQPRYSKLSSLGTGALDKKELPTGSSFGGSDLEISQLQISVFPIISSTVLSADNQMRAATLQSSPLLIEAGKIVVVMIWFWCLIGANYCFNLVNSITGYGTQDI
jgi:hypothetical protein